MKFLISLITALVVTVNSGLTSANRFIDKLASKNTKKIVVLTKEKPSSEENSPSVLGVETQNDDIDSVTFNVNTIFKNGIKVRQGADLSSLTASSIDLGSGQIRAGNILYGVVGGDGIVISSGQTPIISLSLAGGDGIKIDGNKIVNTGIIGLSAGVGISVSGSSITNIDPGSSQNIFKTISVAGQDDIVADKNDDTLTLTAGTGISILTDPTNDKLTFFSNDPSIAAGWTHGVDSIFLTNLTDNVGIGIEDPSAKLEVVGSVKFSGGLNNSSGGIINAGSITGATGFTSSGTITLADLSTGIVHSNIYGVLSSSAVNLANTDVTGILPVAHGGLGLTSVTTGGIVYGSSPNIYSVLGAGGEGEVLTMSSGIPSWATVTGAGGICANCLINNPGSNQTITPADTSATGLIVKQASGGLVDIFKVTDSTGSTAYLRVDSSGNVLLGNGQTTQGIFTVSPSGSHAMSISPSSTVGTPHTGTMTSEDLTENRTWTFPDQSGIICTTAGNCSGTSSAIGGNGSLGYLSKWSGTYALTNSLLYDNGINVGIGTTIPGYKLDINGSLRATGQTLLDNTLTVSNTATMSSALYVKGPASLSSTLGVTGATTLSSTLDVTGNAIFNGNMGIGTANPINKLDIKNGSIRLINPSSGYYATDLNGYGSRGLFLYNYDANFFNNNGASSRLRFTANSIEAMRIDNNGLVGIGTTSPTGKLHVSGAVTGKALAIFDETGDQALLTASASGVTKFIVDHSGNVGIGTTSPGYKLDVNGNIHGSVYFGSSTEYLLTGGGSSILSSYYPITIRTHQVDNPIVFQTNGIERVRINTGGNVGIGTTSPTSKLHVSGAVTGKALAIFDETGDQNIFVASTSGTTKFVINHNGNVGIGTTSPGYQLDVAGTVNATGATTLGSTLGVTGATTLSSTLNVAGLTTIASTAGSDALQLTSSGNKVLGLSTNTNYATFDLLNSTTEPTNKLSNSGFETDLTNWSEVPSYTLNDQFTTDRAAGSVNGTLATDGVNTRTVVDTESKLSISSSQLSIAGGKTSPAWGDPQISYPSVSRVAGKIFYGKMNMSSTNQGGIIGFGRETSGYDAGTIYFASGGDIYYYENILAKVGTYSGSTDYQTAVVLRSTGAYHFIKGGAYTNWTLLFPSQGYVVTPLYPNIKSYNAAFTADNIRIPTATWLPTPLAYDTFTRSDGAIGSSETTGPDGQTTPSLAWTGGAISSNKLVITPTLGSDVVVNGDFDTDSDWTKGTGWSIGSGVATHAAGSESQLIQANLITDTWYQGEATISRYVAGNSLFRLGSTKIATMNAAQSYLSTGRANNSNTNIYGYSAFDGDVDNIIVKPLTLSSLFSSVSTSDSDVIASADVTVTAGTQAGLVTNLDSTSSPANFLIAYHDGTYVKLDKNVGGTYTNLINTAATYSAGATLRVITYHSDANTLKVRVYYNNAMIGSEQTVTDAGIISNTKHGLFSTYSGNSFDNFTLFARGSDGEYGEAPFEELTVSRDTTTKYAGTASAKLVAGGTAGNYLQSVNVGDTSTYSLIAYAYTDGSAVTTDDVNLYYDTAEIATSFTPMGGTGWYKLTGSFTGVASAKDYGVRVKAGKTVYIDNMKVQQGTATTQTMYVTNSGTGVTNLNVQGLINGTQNGIATYVKAGTISDSDFTTATNGLMAIDSTNGRLYLRSDGSWNYIAFTGGFQIPANEAGDLEDGELLLPYVEKKMSDGALHGLYKKFSDVVVGGNATIPTFSDTVDVVFDKPFTDQPVVTFSLMIDSNNTTFIKEGQQAYLQDVSKDGFTLKLPELSPRDFTYTWTAVAVPKMTITRGKSLIQSLINNQGQSSGSASISPTLTLTPTPSEPTKSPTPTPTVTVTPTVSPSPTP